jgi:hypothetical protein
VNGERSLSDVLQDVVRHLQEIVRSEVRLAKVEIRDEARLAVSSVAWLATGVVVALSASSFLLWSAVYLLATQMPMWGATLVVAVVMAFVATVLLVGGIRRVRRIQPIPERTMASMKENLEWIKKPTR